MSNSFNYGCCIAVTLCFLDVFPLFGSFSQTDIKSVGHLNSSFKISYRFLVLFAHLCELSICFVFSRTKTRFVHCNLRTRDPADSTVPNVLLTDIFNHWAPVLASNRLLSNSPLHLKPFSVMLCECYIVSTVQRLIYFQKLRFHESLSQKSDVSNSNFHVFSLTSVTKVSFREISKNYVCIWLFLSVGCHEWLI